MNEKTEIVKIIDPQDPVLETIAQWMYVWWGKEQNFSLEQIKAYYQRAVFADRLPQTFVLMSDGKPAGTFQFAMSDVFVRPDLYPWIKYVYVDPAYRGCGYGRKLVQEAVEQAKRMELKHVYLFTHLVGYYEKFGWKFIEEFETYVPFLGTQRMYALDTAENYCHCK